MRRLKGLSSLGNLKGLGPTAETRLPAIPLYAGPIGEKDEDPIVFDIWQTMGGRERDLKMARACAKLKQRLPQATTPELIVYVWLQERAIDFAYQVQVNGGRASTGGSVVDFVVRSGREFAWRVQGSYWHARPEQMALDDVRKQFIIGAYAGKYQIDGVVDVWESDIYQDRDNVLNLALAGYQLPH